MQAVALCVVRGQPFDMVRHGSTWFDKSSPTESSPTESSPTERSGTEDRSQKSEVGLKKSETPNP